jgi:hypothetical protein
MAIIDWERSKRLTELLAKAAEGIGLSMEETHRMVRLALSMEIDPLPPEKWGARFDFSGPRTELTFWDSLGPVPPPDAEVPIRDAYRHFSQDCEAAEAALQEKLSHSALWAIVINSHDWTVFWSMRHPNPDVRRQFVIEVEKSKAKLIQVAALAEERFKRRGMPQ